MNTFIRLQTVSIAALLSLLTSTLIPAGASAAQTKKSSRRSQGHKIHLVSAALGTTQGSTRKPVPGTVTSSKSLTERGSAASPVSTESLSSGSKEAQSRTSTANSSIASAQNSWIKNFSASLLASVDGPTLGALDDTSAIMDQNFLTVEIGRAHV